VKSRSTYFGLGRGAIALTGLLVMSGCGSQNVNDFRNSLTTLPSSHSVDLETDQGVDTGPDYAIGSISDDRHNRLRFCVVERSGKAPDGCTRLNVTEYCGHFAFYDDLGDPPTKDRADWSWRDQMEWAVENKFFELSPDSHCLAHYVHD
jgi:hypothetical protein